MRVSALPPTVIFERPDAPNLRIETLAEDRIAQVLHLGPYSSERPTIE